MSAVVSQLKFFDMRSDSFCVSRKALFSEVGEQLAGFDKITDGTVFVIQNIPFECENMYGYLKQVKFIRENNPTSKICCIQSSGQYFRSDRKCGHIRPISSVLITKLQRIAGASEVITIDPHNPVIDSSIFETWQRNLKSFCLDFTTIISPDKSMAYLCDDICDVSKAVLVVVDKFRHLDGSIEAKVIGSASDNGAYILIDDIVDSGRTAITAINACRVNLSDTLVITAHLIQDKYQPFTTQTTDKLSIVAEIIDAFSNSV